MPISLAASITFSTGYFIIAQGYIVHYGTGEKEYVLQHHPDAFSQVFEPDSLLSDIVDPDLPFLDMVQPVQQADDGGLAAACMTHDGHGLTRLHGEGNILQYITVIHICKIDIVKFDLPLYPGRAHKSPSVCMESSLSSTRKTLSLATIPICNTLNLSAIKRSGRNSRFRIKEKGNDLAAELPGLCFRQMHDLCGTPPDQQPVDNARMISTTGKKTE